MSEYNGLELFGSDEFLNKIQDQSKLFVKEIEKVSGFTSARFAKKEVWKFDCLVWFWWTANGMNKRSYVVLGSDPKIALDGGILHEYSEEEIKSLKKITKALNWEFEEKR